MSTKSAVWEAGLLWRSRKCFLTHGVGVVGELHGEFLFLWFSVFNLLSDSDWPETAAVSIRATNAESLRSQMCQFEVYFAVREWNRQKYKFSNPEHIDKSHCVIRQK